MKFFPALYYTPHKKAPDFVDFCFRFVQTTVFLLHFFPSSLHNQLISNVHQYL